MYLGICETVTSYINNSRQLYRDLVVHVVFWGMMGVPLSMLPVSIL